MSVDVSMDRYMIYTYHGVLCVCVCVCVCVCILSHLVVSDSLRPHGLQLTRPPCLSLSPRVFSDSCPLSQWCHPTIFPSAAPFSSCPQSFIPSVRVFSNGLTLWRWPKYWSFSFSISSPNKYSGLISFRIDWFDLLAVQGTLKGLLQHHNSVQSLSRVWLFATPWIAARQASLSTIRNH